MIKRRDFCKTLSIAGAGLLIPDFLKAQEFVPYYMPFEGVRHAATWMGYYASPALWERAMIPVVKEELEEIARTIAQFERVNLLVPPEEFQEAEELFENELAITLIEAPLDDFWLRDSGAVFVLPEKKKLFSSIGAVDFGFNGWGNKQMHNADSQLATFMANKIRAELLDTQIRLEGGALEVDGEGTLLLTESCILNDNRNPEMPRDMIEADLKALLGVEKIIWLKGLRGADLTDAQTDFYARFIRPGQVFVSMENNRQSADYVLTRENIRLLEEARDAKGRKLALTILDTPETPALRYSSTDFIASYTQYYLVNDGLIMPLYGDKEADRNAKSRLRQAFPDRKVCGVRIDALASGGAGIHCATQQQPMMK